MENKKWDNLIYRAEEGKAEYIRRVDGLNYSNQQIVKPVQQERVQEFLSVEDNAPFKTKKRLWVTFWVCCAVLAIIYNVKRDKTESSVKKDNKVKEVVSEDKIDENTVASDIQVNETVQNTSPVIGVTEDGMYEYELVGDVVTIKKYVGTETEVVIPDEIAGANKIILGNAAFQNSEITSIDITKNVVEIADGYNFQAVFGNLTTLEKVHIANGLKVLSAYTFAGCTELKEVMLEEGLECIEEFAFHGCSNLTSIEIPSSVKKIGNGGVGTSGVKSITIASDCVVEGTEGHGFNAGLEINYR